MEIKILHSLSIIINHSFPLQEKNVNGFWQKFELFILSGYWPVIFVHNNKLLQPYDVLTPQEVINHGKPMD